jgi:DNA repair protein RecO (recombination protein O)
VAQYEGIIIRLYPSADADLVLRIITRETGKLSLLAKFARKSKKRYGTTFDLLDRGTFHARMGKGSLALVESFIPAPAFRFLRQDLDKITAASVLCDCADLLALEGADESGELFATLTLALEAMENAANVRETLRALYFAIAHLLNIAGFGSPLSVGTPSVKKLRKLLDFVEHCAERKLESKALLEVTLTAVKQEPVA